MSSDEFVKFLFDEGMLSLISTHDLPNENGGFSVEFPEPIQFPLQEA